MRSGSRKLFQGVLGALVLGALGFGATQTFAAPAAAAEARLCTREDLAECSAACREALGDGWRGRCTSNSLGQKSCECVQIVFPGGTSEHPTSPDSRS